MADWKVNRVLHWFSSISQTLSILLTIIFFWKVWPGLVSSSVVLILIAWQIPEDVSGGLQLFPRLFSIRIPFLLLSIILFFQHLSLGKIIWAQFKVLALNYKDWTGTWLSEEAPPLPWPFLATLHGIIIWGPMPNTPALGTDHFCSDNYHDSVLWNQIPKKVQLTLFLIFWEKCKAFLLLQF